MSTKAATRGRVTGESRASSTQLWAAQHRGALLAGAGGALLDLVLYYGDWSTGWKVAHVALSALSGLVIAGLGGWALTQALGQTGVLDRFPSGRDRVAV